MDGSGQVFRTATEFHHGDGFRDEFRGIAGDNVDAQDFVGLGISNDLGKTVRGVTSQGATIGLEAELANANLQPLFLGLILREANAGCFRRGVDDSGDEAVIPLHGPYEPA